MPLSLPVLPGVGVLRLVTAADLAADEAGTQMDPVITHRDAFVTHVRDRLRHLAQLFEMSTRRQLDQPLVDVVGSLR